MELLIGAGGLAVGILLGAGAMWLGVRMGASIVWRAAGHSEAEPIVGHTAGPAVDQDETE